MEAQVPPAHYGVVYTTLRGSHPAFALDCIRFVEVSNSQKQSVSNAFNYVVHNTNTPALLQKCIA